jgi:putative peptidoglycan lipid II flippase
LSSNNLAFIFLISIASTIKSGSISLFTFAYNLQSVPVNIIGVSYSVAAFPTLVKSFTNKDIKSFVEHVISATKQIIFWSLPIISLFIVLRAQIVRVILGSGTFSWADTRITAASIALFVLSLASQGIVLLFVRGYYAAGNTKKPLVINVFSSVMIVVFAYLFINIFKCCPSILSFINEIMRTTGVGGTEMFALPLAYALGSIINFILIWFMFKKDFLNNNSFGIGKTFFDSFLSAITIGVVSYYLLSVFDNIFDINTLLGIFMQGFLSGVLGIVSGILVLLIFKNKELSDIIRTLKKKLRYKRFVAGEQSEL